MIDWQEFARTNNLTPKQFTKEILSVVAVLGAMEIDKNASDADALTFSCEDNISKIEVIVRRI